MLFRSKGQLISSIKIEEFSDVERCTCSQNQIMIKNSSTKKRVKKHLQQLKEKIEENQNVESFLRQRLNSLISSCIEFNIPDDLNYNSRSQQIDEGIRLIASIINRRKNINEIIEQMLSSYKATETEAVFTGFIFDQ